MGTGPYNLPGVSSGVLYKNEKFKHRNNEFLKNAVPVFGSRSRTVNKCDNRKKEVRIIPFKCNAEV